ncbi:MAG: HAD hydrolase family protein [Bacteroidia bacterium]|nr:HAD hydrolase family protein [Bacteroidia bacterium]MCZ2277290.1 HAD hydrolase family protein [Bacteroidia bacterium]
MKNFKQLISKVKCIVFDCDGVLTDGSVMVMPDGEYIRNMSVKDGFAMQFAVKCGLHIAVISGGQSAGIPIRMNRLGIKHVFMGAEDKRTVLENLLKEIRVSGSEVLYIGDDIPDMKAMKIAAIAACPNDAVPEIKAIADYISPLNGGKGCARDVIEQVLKVQGFWQF